MAELADNFAPYAPVGSVLQVITRRRDRGFSGGITTDTLKTMGVSDGNVGRTFQALRFLRLIEEDGLQTSNMERLAKASSAEYASVLAEIVRAAYHSVFTIVDPSQDGEREVLDAFRQYEPGAQRDRMVRLFMGLCEQAGIVPTVSKKARTSTSANGRPPKRPGTAPPKPGRPPVPTQVPTEPIEMPSIPSSRVDHRLISAIMQQLPEDGRWTSKRREKWIRAVTSAVDLIIDITDTADATIVAEAAEDLPLGTQ